MFVCIVFHYSLTGTIVFHPAFSIRNYPVETEHGKNTIVDLNLVKSPTFF